jgi:hypothetical protein
MQVAYGSRVRAAVGLCGFVREDRDEPAVARIEIEVGLLGSVEVGLLEHQRHAEHAFPEVDRCLPVGTDQRDVMDALRLQLGHATPP